MILKPMHPGRAKAALFSALIGTGALEYNSPGSISEIVNSTKSSLADFANNVVYGQNFSRQRYEQKRHKIKTGDTLIDLSQGNYMAADYIKIVNNIENVGALQPGTEIIILSPSEKGRPLIELLDEASSR